MSSNLGAISALKPKTGGRLAALCLSLVLGLGLSGCAADYAGLDLRLDKSPPEGSGVLLEREGIRIPLGIAVSVDAFPRSESINEYEDDIELEFRSDDSRIATVFSTDEPFKFVFTANGVGRTLLRVFIDNEQVDTIPLEVPSPPRIKAPRR